MKNFNEYRKRRKQTGFNIKTFAEIIGSNVCSVYLWEQGKTHPRYKFIEENIDDLIKIVEKLKKNQKNLKKVVDILK